MSSAIFYFITEPREW